MERNRERQQHVPCPHYFQCEQAHPNRLPARPCRSSHRYGCYCLSRWWLSVVINNAGRLRRSKMAAGERYYRIPVKIPFGTYYLAMIDPYKQETDSEVAKSRSGQERRNNSRHGCSPMRKTAITIRAPTMQQKYNISTSQIGLIGFSAGDTLP